MSVAEIPGHSDITAAEHLCNGRHFGSGRNLILRNVQLEGCQFLLGADVSHLPDDLLVMAIFNADSNLRIKYFDQGSCPIKPSTELRREGSYNVTD